LKNGVEKKKKGGNIMTNGIVSEKMSIDQFRDFAETVLRSLPDDISPATAQTWIENPASLSKVLYETFVLPAPITFVVPKDDEWFWLEVDNTIDPMDVVGNSGAGHNPEKWKYLNPGLNGKRVYRVKLMRFGYVQDVDEAREKADKLGYRLVEGQAWDPFEKQFPEPFDKDPICFGGDEWQHNTSGMKACVFCVGDWGGRGVWRVNLYRSNSVDFDEKWRWLVTNK
jgi:hypothetical protein